MIRLEFFITVKIRGDVTCGTSTANADAQNTHNANNPFEVNETMNSTKAKPVCECLQIVAHGICQLASPSINANSFFVLLGNNHEVEK